jgi:hypothetical protein
MPEWLHLVSGWLTRYGVSNCQAGLPPTLGQKIALRASAWLLGVCLKAGVWGRL